MAKDLFTGRSGQLAVMAEFLIRQMNVAVPEVDIGDDIVVVRTDNDEITRVQVKTANAKELISGGEFTAQFAVPMAQLEGGPNQLVYAFVVRWQDRWEEFLVIRRSVLDALRVRRGLGSDNGRGTITLHLTFSPIDVVSKGISLQMFRRRFDPWPPDEAMPK